jgi:hypothetical protein
VKTRRGFLRSILAAPVAAYAAFRGGTILVHSLPLEEFSFPASSAYIGPKLTRIQGELAITGDAMKAIYGGGRGGGKTEMQREMNRQMRRIMDEHREIVEAGLRETSPTYEIFSDSGVRKVGGAGAYPSEVTGA